MFNIKEKKDLMSNQSVSEFLVLFYLSENLYKLNRVLYDKEINKKDVKYDDLKLHMTSVKSVSDHYKWPLSEDELSFLFGTSANHNGKTTTLTLKTLRNGIVHACNITNMKNIIENFENDYKKILFKFIQIFE